MAEHESSKIETVFEEQGSLRKPGLVGRAVRLYLGHGFFGPSTPC